MSELRHYHDLSSIREPAMTSSLDNELVKTQADNPIIHESHAFLNNQPVQNQAVHQIIHGDVYFASEDSASREKHVPINADLDKNLDDAILRSLAFPEMLDRRSNVAEPHTQTCQWIFTHEKYLHWKAARSGLLWIKGKPGSGKSTLMAHLYRQIWSERPATANDPSLYLEFFFSARGSQLQQTPLGMFRSLLNQAFRQDIRSRPRLRGLFRDKSRPFGGDNHAVPTWEWQHPELQSLLASILRDIANHQQITVFVDALDEAGEQNAREIARYFHELNKIVFEASGAVKFCISCRHYPIPSSLASIEVHVEQHNHQDIITYIHDQVTLDEFYTDEDWQVLIQDLIDQSRGVFQWICLVVPMVQKHMADGDSIDDIRQWIRDVPAELEDVYQHILQKVVDRRHRTRSFLLFQWVCLAERPLSVPEVRYALATHSLQSSTTTTCEETPGLIKTDAAMEQLVKSCSGGLLEVINSERGVRVRKRFVFKVIRIVQVVHQTVKDFFTTQGLRLFTTLVKEIPSTVEECHGALYWSCMRYVSAVALPEPDDGSSILRFDKLVSSLPLFDYASENYLSHADKAQSQRSHNYPGEVQMLEQTNAVQELCLNRGYPTGRSPYSYHRTPLHYAALAGLTDLVKFLTSSESMNDINTVDSDNHTALYYAVLKGRITVVEALLAAGADPDIVPGFGRTALKSAIDRGHVAVAEALVRAGADPNSGSDFDETVLERSARMGYRKLCSFLLTHGAKYRRDYSDQFNDLMLAIASCDVEAVRTCIEEGADVNCHDGIALRKASKYGYSKTVETLIKAGADVNHLSKSGICPLMEATWSGSVDVVKLLIEAGADPDIHNTRGESALQLARERGHDEIAQMLLDAGAK